MLIGGNRVLQSDFPSCPFCMINSLKSKFWIACTPFSAIIKMSAHKAKLLSAFSNASKLEPPDQKCDDGRKYLQGSIHARLWALLRPIWVSEPARLEEDGGIWFPRNQRTHEGFWRRKKAGAVDLLPSTVVWTFSRASVKLNFAPSKACLRSGTTVRK